MEDEEVVLHRNPSSEKIDCFLLFNTTLPEIQALLRDKETLRKKAIYGQYALKACFASYILKKFGPVGPRDCGQR